MGYLNQLHLMKLSRVALISANSSSGFRFGTPCHESVASSQSAGIAGRPSTCGTANDNKVALLFASVNQESGCCVLKATSSHSAELYNSA